MLHCKQGPAVSNEIKEFCFDTFLTITTFFLHVVQFLRQAGDDSWELTCAAVGETSVSKKLYYYCEYL